MRYFILGSMLVLLGIGTQTVSADHLQGHPEHAEHVHEAGLLPTPEVPKERNPVVVQPHQAVVEVRGVVCSFCTYGIEKKIGKLSGVDTGQFRRGVFTDIQNQRLTLALRPKQPIDLQSIQRAIQQAGYETVRVHLRLSGPVHLQGDRTLLTHEATGQRFDLSTKERSLAQNNVVDIQVHIDLDPILSLQEQEPIPVKVDRIVREP